MKNYRILILQSVAALMLLNGCNIDPEYYSEVAPDNFYDSPGRVYQRLGRAYIHWSYNEGMGFYHSDWAFLQEFTTDELCLPVRGGDWYDGGQHLRPQRHDFTPTTPRVNGAWNAVGMGVATAWNIKEDLDRYVNFETTFPQDPEGTRNAVLLQMDVLVASFYLHGIDFFGGYPIYRSNNEPLQPRASDVQVFNFIDSLLRNAIPKLPKKENPLAVQTGYVDRGVAATLLARLYFNAEVYIRRPMYQRCAEICDSIIKGHFGEYMLDTDFRKIFGWGNETCPEIIWSVPSDNSKRKVDAGNYIHSLHYESKKTLGNMEMEAYNGHCLMPSLDGDGKTYVAGRANASPKASKLGSPFAKFEDTDLRKQQYKYEGSERYVGMFLMGKQKDCIGNREYKGDTIVFVDQIAYMKKHGTVDFKEGLENGEENSGIRLMKFSPVPTSADKAVWYNPDRPIIRLAEINYMLAECKLRLNSDLTQAAKLINDVRKRYFENGIDPNPVTAANLDKYRMLDEWMIEFIGENRRRTDLIRWNEYTLGRWFDHEPDGSAKAHYYRFPVPLEAIGANNLLTQDTDYATP